MNASTGELTPRQQTQKRRALVTAWALAALAGALFVGFMLLVRWAGR